MKQHIMHFDDCGCLTERLETALRAYEELSTNYEELLKDYTNLLEKFNEKDHSAHKKRWG